MRDAFAVAVVVPFLIGAALAPAPADRDVVLHFEDPAIVESSGLVVTGDLVVTVNDSGDSARVFAVDPGTGRTVGVTTWDAEPTDVEALAPAGPGEVWVGDIGDNTESRDSVTVTRVPVGRGDRAVAGASYELTYPGGAAHDAEALLAHPRTGRLFVVTKGVLGGEVYAAPSSLRADGPNRLERIGEAPGIVTDGAFFPDARHVMLRNYGRAYLLDFPSLEPVADLDVPAQKQGEGLAIDADDTVYLSSEGARSAVLRVALPEEMTAALAGSASPSASPSASSSASSSPSASPAPGTGLPSMDDDQRSAVPWLVGFAIFGIGIVVLVRALRPR